MMSNPQLIAAPPPFEAAREGVADGKKGGRRAVAIVEKTHRRERPSGGCGGGRPKRISGLRDNNSKSEIRYKADKEQLKTKLERRQTQEEENSRTETAAPPYRNRKGRKSQGGAQLNDVDDQSPAEAPSSRAWRRFWAIYCPQTARPSTGDG